MIDSEPSSDMGRHVVPAGDVNADGFDDVVVSDPKFEVDPDTRGVIRLYLGSPSGLTTVAHWSFRAPRGSWLQSVAPAGDFNGDGYGDFVLMWQTPDTGTLLGTRCRSTAATQRALQIAAAGSATVPGRESSNLRPLETSTGTA